MLHQETALRGGLKEMIRLPSGSSDSVMQPDSKLYDKVREELTNRLEYLKELQDQETGTTDPGKESDLLKIVHTCQQLGFIPLPDNMSSDEAKQLYKYMDQDGRVCVAKEYVEGQPQKPSKAKILNDILDMVKAYKEEQLEKNKTNYEDKNDYRKDQEDDLAYKYCVSKKKANECSVEECEAFVPKGQELKTYNEAATNYLKNNKDQDYTVYSRLGKGVQLDPVDQDTNSDATVVCLPGPRLHLKKMERIKKDIVIKSQSRKALKNEIKQLTDGLRQEEISKLQSFVLPTFHARETETAETVLSENRKKLKDLEGDIQNLKLLYNHYAKIAVQMRLKTFQTKTKDDLCKTAKTGADCAAQKTSLKCKLYNISPINVWTLNTTNTSSDPLTKPDDPYAKYVGSQQCRHPDALIRRKPLEDDTPDAFKLFKGGSTTSDFITEADLHAGAGDEDESSDDSESDSESDSDDYVPDSNNPEGGDENSQNSFIVIRNKNELQTLNTALLERGLNSSSITQNIQKNRDWINTVTNQMEHLFSQLTDFDHFRHAPHPQNKYNLKDKKRVSGNMLYPRFTETITKNKFNEAMSLCLKQSSKFEDLEDAEYDTVGFSKTKEANNFLKSNATNIKNQTSKDTLKQMFLRFYNILKSMKDIGDNVSACTKTTQNWQLWLFFYRFAIELFGTTTYPGLLEKILPSPFEKAIASLDNIKNACLTLEFYENVLRSMARPSFAGERILVDTQIVKKDVLDSAQLMNEEEQKNRMKGLPPSHKSYRQAIVLSLQDIDVKENVKTYLPQFVAFPKFGNLNEFHYCELDLNDHEADGTAATTDNIQKIRNYGMHRLSKCPNPLTGGKKNNYNIDEGQNYFAPMGLPKDYGHGKFLDEANFNDRVKTVKVDSSDSSNYVKEKWIEGKTNSTGIEKSNILKKTFNPLLTKSTTATDKIQHPIYETIKEHMLPQFGNDEAKQKNVLMVLAQLKARDATNADEFLNKRGTFTVLEAGGTAHDVDYISPDMNVVSLMVNDNSNGGRGSPTSVAVSSRYEPATTIQMERV